MTFCDSGEVHYGDSGAYVAVVPGPRLESLDARTTCGPHVEVVFRLDMSATARTAQTGDLPGDW